MAQPLLLIVDAANVVGSVPDGWWHDRVAATRRLRDALVPVSAAGLPDHGDHAVSLPDHGDHAVSLPGPVEVVLVVEGVAASVDSVPGVRVVPASGSGDDAIVTLVAASPERQVTVVTGDRGLRERVGTHGANLLGPRSVPRR